MPSGTQATKGRSVAPSPSIRATARANCSPAPPLTAAGCQGSRVPLTRTPAAPAADQAPAADGEQIPADDGQAG